MWYNIYAQEYKINEGVLETMSGGSTNNELGFMDVLQIIFIVLKLVGVINWSWWAVLLPIWISLAILGIYLLTTN